MRDRVFYFRIDFPPTDWPTVEQALTTARVLDVQGRVQVSYEHGVWWATSLDTGDTWALYPVVSQEPGGDVRLIAEPV